MQLFIPSNKEDSLRDAQPAMLRKPARRTAQVPEGTTIGRHGSMRQTASGKALMLRMIDMWQSSR